MAEQKQVTALILAGGKGTRLHSVVNDRPKPLAIVAYRPFIMYQLDQLVEAGIQKVIITTGYKPESFSFLPEYYRGMRIVFTMERTPLGTAGGIGLAQAGIDTPFLLVMNGDTLIDESIAPFLENTHDCTIKTVQVQDTTRYSRILTKDSVVKSITKDMQGCGYINAGMYLISSKLFKTIPIKPASLEEKYLNEWTVHTAPSSAYFIDIGVPEDFATAQQYFKKFQQK